MDSLLKGFATDLVRALVTSAVLAVLIVGGGYVYLRLTVPEQTATGLEGVR